MKKRMDLMTIYVAIGAILMPVQIVWALSLRHGADRFWGVALSMFLPIAWPIHVYLFVQEMRSK